MVGGETARVREDHVGDAGAALQAEDRDTRMGRMRTNHDDRQRDQPRVRIMAVLGHHERPAVRGVGALFGVVGTALERQLACMRAGRHGDGRRTAGEVEVAEPEREDGDQGQAGDPASPEAFCDGLLAVTGEIAHLGQPSSESDVRRPAGSTSSVRRVVRSSLLLRLVEVAWGSVWDRRLRLSSPAGRVCAPPQRRSLPLASLSKDRGASTRRA